MSGPLDQVQLTSAFVIPIGFFWGPGSRIRAWLSEEVPRASL